MSINDIADELEGIARQAALESGAVVPCTIHSDVLLHRGDPDADKRAYAFANVGLKNAGLETWRTEAMAAVKDEFIQAADGECPLCYVRGD